MRSTASSRCPTRSRVRESFTKTSALGCDWRRGLARRTEHPAVPHSSAFNDAAGRASNAASRSRRPASSPPACPRQWSAAACHDDDPAPAAIEQGLDAGGRGAVAPRVVAAEPGRPLSRRALERVVGEDRREPVREVVREARPARAAVDADPEALRPSAASGLLPRAEGRAPAHLGPAGEIAVPAYRRVDGDRLAAREDALGADLVRDGEDGGPDPSGTWCARRGCRSCPAAAPARRPPRSSRSVCRV